MRDVKNVAFVCLHGAAKSLIAAAYFNRIAREKGLAVSASTSGPEPDPEVPPYVIDGLLEKGIDVRGQRPVLIDARSISEADLIVSFACDAGTKLAPGTPSEGWDDCPAVSDGFAPAWQFITPRVDQLIDKFQRRTDATSDRRGETP
jgi:arsenate reductase (thioredoxin)